jgi:cell division initiation protein
MMTPQDIREKTFEKAIFGGYDANAVDEFLENAAADLSALSKENAMLKSKMKILVNKIEEYRSTEDAMRLALLSAHKFGAQLQNEAKENSEALLNEARAAATALVKNAKNEVYEEEMRLVQAKRASAQFIENMRMLCTKQLDFLDALGELKMASNSEAKTEIKTAPAASKENIDDAVKSIEDSVENADDADEPLIDIGPVGKTDEAVQADNPTRLFRIGNENGESAPRTQFSFERLHFGEKADV